VLVRCPFYGFRWPDKTTDLVQIGGNECGLDLDHNGPCKMEQQGRTVNFDYCEVALQWKPVLETFRNEIRFCGSGEPVRFAEWRRAPLTRKAS
jgi:hypothetical protein